MYFLPLTGFSIVAGVVLLAAYLHSAVYIKSLASMLAAIAFTLVLTTLQGYHLLYFIVGLDALEEPLYIFCLFVAPGLFLLFGRAVVLPGEPFNSRLLLCLLPCVLPLLLPMSVALPLLLLSGAGYAVWLGRLAFSFHQTRRQYRFELMFSVCMAVFAGITLVVGALIPWTDVYFFYAFYSQAIGLGYVLVLYALVAIPGFVEDLFELTREKYATSTLSGVDVSTTIESLERLMNEQAVYADTEANLNSIADALGLTSHQLSELVNRHLQQSFSQYLRRFRINAAKHILHNQPQQSVLSVAMEVGYRSQSTFYAAFKQETGISPGDYRTSTLRNDQSVST